MARRGENIYHRKDGRWEGRYWVGKRPDGRAIYKSVYGARYCDVRKELALRRAEFYIRQERVTPNFHDERFEERAAYYLEHKVKPYVKESTLVGYGRLVAQHLIPAFGGIPLCSMEPENLQRYFSSQVDVLSQGTLHNIFSLLRTILNDAYQDGRLTRRIWENVRLPRAAKPAARVLSQEEQTEVETLALEEGRLEFILCLYTGVRLGELCALQWEDVDWAERKLVVRHSLQRISQSGSSRVVMGTPKSAASQRKIPLPSFLLKMLAEMRQSTGEGARFLFPGKRGDFCDMRTMQARFKRLADRLGLAGAHVHTLRHTYATRCLERGIGIETLCALLGHSVPTITLRYYAHSTEQQRADSMQNVPLLSGKPSALVSQARKGRQDKGFQPFRN